MASVLLLTANSTLSVQFALQGEWEVVTTPSAGLEADVVVVDDDGIRPLAQQIIGQVEPSRTIVITARELDLDGVTRIMPPYRLEDLYASVRAIASGSKPEPVVPLAALATVPDDSGTAPSADGRLFPDRGAPGPETVEEEVTSASSLGGRVRDELRSATSAADELCDLLGRMPALARTPRVAALVAEEIADAVGAPTVGLWGRSAAARGYAHLGGTGLTAGERGVILSLEHPLVADALASKGTAVGNTDVDPATVTGLPAARYPSLVLVPVDTTPVGDLLVVVGMEAAVPEVFDVVESILRACTDALQLSASLGALHQRFGPP